MQDTLAIEPGFMSWAIGRPGSGLSQRGGDRVVLDAPRGLDAPAWEDRVGAAAPLDGCCGDGVAMVRDALPLVVGMRVVGAMVVWCVVGKRESEGNILISCCRKDGASEIVNALQKSQGEREFEKKICSR